MVGVEERSGVEWRRYERSKTVSYVYRGALHCSLAIIGVTLFVIMTAF
jgi:hypothetical protein